MDFTLYVLIQAIPLLLYSMAMKLHEHLNLYTPDSYCACDIHECILFHVHCKFMDVH